MFEPKSLVPKPDRSSLKAAHSEGSAEPKQRRMMVIALTLLLVALGIVLYRDRDFWFPDAQDAQELEAQPTPGTAATTAPAQPIVAKTVPPTVVRHRGAADARPAARNFAPAVSSTSPGTTPANTAIERTVLPPLEVEVVAGNVHRALRPGSNSVRVDLQPGSPTQSMPEASNASTPPETAATLTSASERVELSADASEIVSRSVRPGYPMLARQMKVQGSVILQALISRDGAIQDLHVMSGPPILAGAAREAVRQWRFKPHYLGSETVETQAKITVNFTISTN